MRTLSRMWQEDIPEVATSKAALRTRLSHLRVAQQVKIPDVMVVSV